MLAIKDAESHGKHVKELIEELLNCEKNEAIVGITIELLNSMQVLMSGAPTAVKERVQMVLSKLIALSRDVAHLQVLDSENRQKLVEIVKSIGAVSETLVNWYINKKLRHEGQIEQPAPELVPAEEVELVRKFSNFLTRRTPRLYLPTLTNPDTALEISFALFCKSYSKLGECSSNTPYTEQSEQVILLILTVSSLLDIEDRLFVNRFPYRAQVFSFTEKLVRRFREEKTVFDKRPQLRVVGVGGDKENIQTSALSLLAALCEAVKELVEACRERLTGDISLKRAESMALRPGGPLPKCLYNVKQDKEQLGIRAAGASMSVTLRCQVEVTHPNHGRREEQTMELETMRLASVKCITKQLGVKLRLDPDTLRLSTGSGDITNNTQLRAGDLSDNTLYIYTSNSKTKLVAEQSDKSSMRSVIKTAIEATFARAVFDFHVNGDHHLSFTKGDIVQVTKKHCDGWWDGNFNKKTGTFPANFVEEMNEAQVLAAMTSLNGINPIQEEPAPLTDKTAKSRQTLESPKRTPKRTPYFSTPEPKTPRMKGRYVRSSEDSASTDRRSQRSNTQKIQGSLKEGLLKKESSGGKFWNSRYFVLHDDRMVYYKTVEARPPPAGVVCFSDLAFAAVSTKIQGPCFTLQGKPGKRSYHLMARSRDDMNEWIQQTNQAMRLNRKKSRMGGGGEGGGRERKLSFECAVRVTAAASCLEYLMSDSRYKNKNLLRASGNEREVKHCLKLLERGEMPEIELIPSPHTVVRLLKDILRESHDSVPALVPAKVIRELQDMISKDQATMEDVRASLLTLDPDTFKVVRGLVKFFSLVISNSEENSVTILDIARTFGVLIFTGQDVTGVSQILKYLIKHEDVIFA